MAILRSYSSGLALPGIGLRGRAQIDWAHPLANGLSYVRLLNKNLGIQPDFIDNGTEAGLSGTSTAVIAPSQSGLGIANQGIFSAGNVSYNVPQTAGTIVLYSTVSSWSPTDGVYRKLFQASDSGVLEDFALIKFSDNNWYCGWNASADNRAVVAASGTFNTGDTFSAALTWNTAGGTSFYTKGVLRVNNPANPSPFATGAGSTGNFGIGSSDNNATARLWAPSVGADAIYYVVLWSRVLSASEIALLSSDPYCFLIPAEGEMPALFTPAVGGSFLAAWARGSNCPVIGTGNY